MLEQMAQAIYREWFVHFRYPGHENADASSTRRSARSPKAGICSDGVGRR